MNVRILIAVLLLLGAAAPVYGGYTLTDGQWRLYRSNVMDTTFSPRTYSECHTEADRRTKLEASQGRTSGSIQWRCSVPIIGRFDTNSMTCPPLPLAQTRTAQCPAPLIGTFGQIATYLSRPWPECSVFSNDWQPTITPAGVCLAPPRSVVLHWTSPTQNTDGSALTNLTGFQIHYGTRSTTLSRVINVPDPKATAYTVRPLTPGTYYFAITAMNSAGAQSSRSSIVSKTVK